MTLGDYLDRWLEYKEIRIKPSTYRGYKNMVVHHIKPALGRVTLAKLTPLHLETLYRNMLKKEVGPKDNKRSMAPRMCQLAHAVLHQALEQAIRWSLCQGRNFRVIRDFDETRRLWQPETCCSKPSSPNTPAWRLALGR
jgi:hypothetical protein